MTYTAPVKDMQFVLEDVLNISQLQGLATFEDLSSDFLEAVLWECGKFASDVFAPLNEAADKIGATFSDGKVTMPKGFKEAYAQYVESGWASVSFDPEYGGQGLPQLMALACTEIALAANSSFLLCPILTAGAVEAIGAHGTQEQKDTYLAKLISSEWAGTMNLTEPHAGSDVGSLKSKATPQEDGTYRIKGTKIFISFGDHDMAENIIHLVLARLPGAPEGTKGLSLFVVPKFLVNEDGSLGDENDVATVSIEHKMGLHGSPTCTLAFGENEGAIGYLLGEENKGMSCMFTMMNAARLAIGLQGSAIIERAYQQALAFAQERTQGKNTNGPTEAGGMTPIINHADVRRMLYTMKALGAASRSICYANALAADVAHNHADEDVRKKAKLREELLTPLSKGFSTDMCDEATRLNIQIHGGMGYIEETGAAQYYRESRLLCIYEGTNGIQAIDLAFRKLLMQGGQAVRDFLADINQAVSELKDEGDETLALIGQELASESAKLEEAVRWLGEKHKDNVQDVFAGATPYARAFGYVAGAYYLGLGALAAKKKLDLGEGDTDFYKTKIQVAKFYALNILPLSEGNLRAAKGGSEVLFELTADQLAI